jgi:GNAT superfamily N-acetyltransferase
MARVAIDGDAAEIVRVTNLAYRVEDFFVRGDRTTEAEIRERMTRTGAAFLVIDRPAGDRDDADGEQRAGASDVVSHERVGHGDRRIAGSVFVQVKDDRGFFAMLSVDPALQKGGVGRRLIEAVEAHCRAAGCRFLDIDVVNLRRELPAFYGRFGFAPYGTAPFADAWKLTRPAHVVLMTKPLLDLWA